MNDGIYYDADHGVHQDGDGGVYLWEGRAMSDRVKPAYEIVTAAELRVGDVATYGSPDEYEPFRVESIKPCEDDDDEIEVGLGPRLSMDLMKEEQVFRQLPPERNPDVLMRALQDLHDLAIAHAGIDVVGPIDGRIQEAIRELESEAGDGTTQAHD